MYPWRCCTTRHFPSSSPSFPRLVLMFSSSRPLQSSSNTRRQALTSSQAWVCFRSSTGWRHLCHVVAPSHRPVEGRHKPSRICVVSGRASYLIIRKVNGLPGEEFVVFAGKSTQISIVTKSDSAPRKCHGQGLLRSRLQNMKPLWTLRHH